MPTPIYSPRSKYAWSVAEWCEATGVSRSKAYQLMQQHALRFVKFGDRRLIIEHPADFLASLNS